MIPKRKEKLFMPGVGKTIGESFQTGALVLVLNDE